VPQVRRPLIRSYAEIAAAQGMTKPFNGRPSRVNRMYLSRAERAVVDAGPPTRRALTVEELATKNEKYVLSLLRRGRGRPGYETERATKAAGHLATAANLRAATDAPETPYAIMDRLELTEAERAQLGNFEGVITWSRIS